MRLNVYAVRDLKAGLFGALFCSMNDATMQREISQAIRNPEHPWSLYPDDYQVFNMGTYDQETGEQFPQAPKFMFNMSVLKEAQAIG